MIARTLFTLFLFCSLCLALNKTDGLSSDEAQDPASPLFGKNCIELNFAAELVKEGSYVIKFDAKDTCANCSINSNATVMVLSTLLCEFATSFEPLKGAQPDRIEIDMDNRRVMLSGADEAAMLQLLARICEQGGVPVAVNEPIEIDTDEDDIILEIRNGAARSITGPAPISIRATVRDSCKNQATSMLRIDPE